MRIIAQIDPFRCGILLSIGETSTQFRASVHTLNDGKRIYKELSGPDETGPMHARTWMLEGGESIIRLHALRSEFDHGRLIHEILHAVLHCLRNKATPVTEDTEEVLCYSVQRIYEQVVIASRK